MGHRGLESEAMKGHFTFSKSPGLEPPSEAIYCLTQEPYPSAQVQSAYSTAPADRVILLCTCRSHCSNVQNKQE